MRKIINVLIICLICIAIVLGVIYIPPMVRSRHTADRTVSGTSESASGDADSGYDEKYRDDGSENLPIDVSDSDMTGLEADQGYNYLSNTRLLADMYIKVSAVLKLGDEFDAYVKKTYKDYGTEYVLQSAEKNYQGINMYAVSIKNSGHTVHISYNSQKNRFKFSR